MGFYASTVPPDGKMLVYTGKAKAPIGFRLDNQTGPELSHYDGTPINDSEDWSEDYDRATPIDWDSE
jgi:hypothetical protein